MKLEYFFARYPVFTRDEYCSYLNSQGVFNINTQRELLAYHVKKGHIVKIRRGFYATVPAAILDPKTMPVDAYLIAGRISNDAVLAYHTALDFFGIAYSAYYEFYFLSNKAIKTFQFQDNKFRRIAFPIKLTTKKQEQFAVSQQDRQGLDLRVTSLERTLVDVLNRPDLSGGYEEIWRSMEMAAVLDVDRVIEYAILLDNATTIAQVGFFLEEHQKEFSVTEKHLAKLEKHIPKSKHYINRLSRGEHKFLSRWNLMVPVDILEKSWEEPDDFI